MVTAAAATWPALRPIYPKGFTATTPRKLNWGTKERRCIRRNLSAVRMLATFELKPPPYPLDGLEPHMSTDTLECHWGKHHRAYVENLNKQIEEANLDGMSLEDVVIATYNKGDMLPAFNNAAQVWNHDFFWESIKPGGGGKPSGELLRLIERDFGSFEKFVEQFKSAAATQFGSGWAWLVYKANKLNVDNAVNPRPSEDDKKLVVVKSPNAVNPLVWDYSPLLTIDVWEVLNRSLSSPGVEILEYPPLRLKKQNPFVPHAYYLDFQNRRPDYISTFFEKLVSWETVSARLEAAKARAAAREMEEEQNKQKQDVDDDGDNAEENEDLPTSLDDDSDDSDN